jgi:hypothetical protein
VQNSSFCDVYHSSAFELGMMTNCSRHKNPCNTALVVVVALGVVGFVCELGPS